MFPAGPRPRRLTPSIATGLLPLHHAAASDALPKHFRNVSGRNTHLAHRASGLCKDECASRARSNTWTDC
ncbi:hypothetical protein HBI56_041020 [Parastagonospora nodorum]|uniref:Uncharacterized protein n=1 Tax=Phaeosphaeria nodorum (strain SN15 / ATCC MYA-4574 / FGSC 10173) TaxID=321614 RepID=A0A7U2EUE9_PHANO|nr:hypothetical protein HBH56_065740 [Parastagonospora nodorum]QRC93293.1 hypothetical protein JI435_403560 [Parastagonospora nodorum SN15]KAH3932600.1 hypothetical protein HBH54_082350 [Parastagonospora nodorum]KAH3955073.1 hypothetical protein HBH53_012040 [Parastagonospora nodorum]KAH3986095.1 hypothetical protein HBH52_043240 [Parastagonospora nodorum]